MSEGTKKYAHTQARMRFLFVRIEKRNLFVGLDMTIFEFGTVFVCNIVTTLLINVLR